MPVWRVLALLGCALVTLSCGGGGADSGSGSGLITLRIGPELERTLVEAFDPGGCVVTGLTLAETNSAGDYGTCDRRDFRIVTFSLLAIPAEAEILEAAVTFDVVGSEGDYQAAAIRINHATTLTSETDVLLGIGPPPTSFAFSPELTIPTSDVVAAGLAHWVDHAHFSSDSFEIAIGPSDNTPNGRTDNLVLENFRLIVQYREPLGSNEPESP